MILDVVTGPEMQAARILTGVTMCGLLGAPLFGAWAQRVRIGILFAYVTGIAAFVIYTLR